MDFDLAILMKRAMGMDDSNDVEQSEEMEKLISMLENAGVEHEVGTHRLSGTKQVHVPNKENEIVDAVSFWGSYGGEDGMIEVWGEGFDDAIGYLTAEEAFEIITKVMNGEDV